VGHLSRYMLRLVCRTRPGTLTAAEAARRMAEEARRPFRCTSVSSQLGRTAVRALLTPCLGRRAWLAVPDSHPGRSSSRPHAEWAMLPEGSRRGDVTREQSASHIVDGSATIPSWPPPAVPVSLSRTRSVVCAPRDRRRRRVSASTGLRLSAFDTWWVELPGTAQVALTVDPVPSSTPARVSAVPGRVRRRGRRRPGSLLTRRLSRLGRESTKPAVVLIARSSAVGLGGRLAGGLARIEADLIRGFDFVARRRSGGRARRRRARRQPAKASSPRDSTGRTIGRRARPGCRAGVPTSV